jgi:hypothetical protein
MPQVEARAWWAEVEHLREPLARRRAADTSPAAHANRRTVQIRGQAIDAVPARPLRDVSTELSRENRRARPAPTSGRRRARRGEPFGSRPDRLAAWAVVFGLLMAIVAASTAHGATPVHRATVRVVHVHHVELAASRSLARR